jgi:hypothetical protein
VFAERARIHIVDPGAAAVLVAYIHNNPVRAGVVTDALDSTWTTHRAVVGHDVAPPWLDVPWILSACGFDASPSGRARFDDFVRRRASLGRDRQLSGPVDAHDEAPAWRPLGGHARLADAIVSASDADGGARRDIVVRHRAAWALAWTGPPEIAVSVGARVLGVREGELDPSNRRPAVVRAREVLLLAWRDGLARPVVEIAEVLGLSRGGASRCLARAGESSELRALAADVAGRVRGLPEIVEETGAK